VCTKCTFNDVPVRDESADVHGRNRSIDESARNATEGVTDHAELKHRGNDMRGNDGSILMHLYMCLD
jgi:hypothetical protein